MELPIIRDLVIILTLSVIVILATRKLHIPNILGFLITGILAGPHGLQLINNPHQVEMLSEIGIILLLFTIGIEFSFQTLRDIKRTVIIGGLFQVTITIAVTFLVTWLLGFPWAQAVFLGFLASLSSTAVVLKLIQERGEISLPHGRNALGILIFQDLIIVPMILFTPMLSGESDTSSTEMLITIIKAAAVITILIYASRTLVPKLLTLVARTQSRELFLLTIIVLAFAVAWLTSSIGLSLALGAFLAGLIISESEYSHQAFGNILPFLDVFTSFFFVSIGMLLNLQFVIDNPLLILIATLGVMILKAIIAGFATIILGYPFRIVVMVGLILSQVGEFSFILSKVGLEANILETNAYQTFLAVAVLSIGITPFIFKLAPKLADYSMKLPLPERLRSGVRDLDIKEQQPEDHHLIVVGYGLVGRNVAQAARFADLRYNVIEMNPQTVKKEQQKNTPIFYGDATQATVLNHAGIKKAMVLVIAIPDSPAMRRIITNARTLNPNLHIIVRSRFINDSQTYHDLGADEVIPEEFETSVEIFARVLAKFLVPREQIEELVEKIREGEYKMLRSLSVEDNSRYSTLKVETPKHKISTWKVAKNSNIAGKRVDEVENILKEFSVIAISRDSHIISNPYNEILQAGDLLFVLGSTKNSTNLRNLCRNQNLQNDSTCY
ncbi:MAG: cation:proton antiporter [Bacteroidales bacterium]